MCKMVVETMKKLIALCENIKIGPFSPDGQLSVFVNSIVNLFTTYILVDTRR